MKSLVITIVRKPLDGTLANNAIKHGSGPINIDASRVALNGSLKPSTTGRRTRKDDKGWGVGQSDCTYVKGTGLQFSSEGRWPANFVLVHQPECECVGVKKVQTQWGQATRRTTSDPGYQGGWIGQDKKVGYTGADGKETIANWICTEDCSAQDLDAQSGGMRGVLSKSDDKRDTNRTLYSKDGQATKLGRRGPENSYHDQGGASRFFKQFKP